ncbi:MULTISPECIES: copper chaperone PCu(A)C [Thermomonospora]|uniref:Lipoprotein n=1 Tax=Thermomonospora curvata (strain ATCC 19995 / DSM 43183 / JCM 3096 / KCTC 9072 / NBRC 15933 / NCIMB 10081 / Henssen B9) TaxID=471852 RepID=D1A5D4_THECD|nr:MULTISPECIES: copper chaperone PCu(A)C [Thermomonospora]ACY96294.1 hypothetical protein Tcur_0701 [Thermomonospora curvata DSM 43183]PKK15712.1 MAG: hypothetical protein BUE48_003400 [Thermomonospora sp. CIF 1]
MIRNSRRVFALTVAGAIALAPVLSGCAAGHTPQTAMPTQLTEGVNVSVPQDAKVAQIDIRNMFVLGPAPGSTAAAGSAVPLYATLINQVQGKADRLVEVSSPAFRQAQIAGGGIALPAAGPEGGTAVRLIAEGQQMPPVVLQGLTSPLIGGETIRLTLRFEQAGSITVPVPVVPWQQEFATYSPVPTAPAPSPTGAETATASPTADTETPEATPTVPSASPS